MEDAAAQAGDERAQVEHGWVRRLDECAPVQRTLQPGIGRVNSTSVTT